MDNISTWTLTLTKTRAVLESVQNKSLIYTAAQCWHLNQAHLRMVTYNKNVIEKCYTHQWHTQRNYEQVSMHGTEKHNMQNKNKIHGKRAMISKDIQQDPDYGSFFTDALHCRNRNAHGRGVRGRNSHWRTMPTDQEYGGKVQESRSTHEKMSPHIRTALTVLA